MGDGDLVVVDRFTNSIYRKNETFVLWDRSSFHINRICYTLAVSHQTHSSQPTSLLIIVPIAKYEVDCGHEVFEPCQALLCTLCVLFFSPGSVSHTASKFWLSQLKEQGEILYSHPLHA